MNISTNTLLQLLFANGHEELVALAVKLENNIDIPTPEFINVSVGKDCLAKMGKKQTQDRGYWTVIQLPVITHNKFKLKDNFYVQLPTGEFKWVTPSNESLSALVDIEPEPTKAEL